MRGSTDFANANLDRCAAEEGWPKAGVVLVQKVPSPLVEFRSNPQVFLRTSGDFEGAVRKVKFS